MFGIKYLKFENTEAVVEALRILHETSYFESAIKEISEDIIAQCTGLDDQEMANRIKEIRSQVQLLTMLKADAAGLVSINQN